MYNADQWKVMTALAVDLPKRAVVRTKNIVAKFRNREDADRIVRNSYRKLRDEEHIEICDRGEYRLTPAGAKFFNKMKDEGFKPSSGRASTTPKKAAKKAVSKKKAKKKAPVKKAAPKKAAPKKAAKAAPKKAAAKKAAPKKAAAKKVSAKPANKSSSKKKVSKVSAMMKKASGAKTPPKTEIKADTKTPPKTEAKSGNGITDPKPTKPAATTGLTW